MRRFFGSIRDSLGVVFFLYCGSAILLLNLLDAGIIRSVGASCSVPWLEDACWYYSLPALMLMLVYILWVLLRDAIVRRKTRKEVRQVIAQIKSNAEKKES